MVRFHPAISAINDEMSHLVCHICHIICQTWYWYLLYSDCVVYDWYLV